MAGSILFLSKVRQVRYGRVFPKPFRIRFQEKLTTLKLDRGKLLDLCELNPSPSSRVVLAAIRRWGRSNAEIERATNRAVRLESTLLSRRLGSLQRLSGIAVALGFLGMLLSLMRVLRAPDPDWTATLASALQPMTASIVLALLLLVAHDGLRSRFDNLVQALERTASDTIDALADQAPLDASKTTLTGSAAGLSHRWDSGRQASRAPHQFRVDLPNAVARALGDEQDLYDL
jgi:biopolymer transport protein ExbB